MASGELHLSLATERLSFTNVCRPAQRRPTSPTHGRLSSSPSLSTQRFLWFRKSCSPTLLLEADGSSITLAGITGRIGVEKNQYGQVKSLIIPLAVVLPPPARGPGTLIPSAQRLVWAAKQPLGNAALGALFA